MFERARAILMKVVTTTGRDLLNWGLANKLSVMTFLCCAAASIAVHGKDSFAMGCAAVADSIVAAVIFAWLHEAATRRKEGRRARQAREKYLEELKSGLLTAFGRLLWFESCKSDSNFNWRLPPAVYVSYGFARQAYVNHPPASLAWSEVISRLNDMRTMHSPAGLAKLSVADRERVVKMFQIVCVLSKGLLETLEQMESHRIELAANGLMDYDEVKSVCQSVRLGMRMLLVLNGTNFAVAIDSLLAALRMVAGKSLERMSLSVELHASF